MKTLKSIHLKNFQSHKNTLITFAEQGALTVITGPSDSGKSAVIRGLRWVFYNVPQGDGFIFNAEDKCSVLLTYDDGTTVERIRSRGGVNRYIVNGETLEGFGTGVPLEVRQATGIRKLEIGDQSVLLNLSEQLDGPFLGKSVSGPARAKVLGKLAGTEEIDYAGKEIGTDIYRAKKQKELYERDIEGLGKQIARYDFIYDWERLVYKADIILTQAKNRVVEIKSLKALIQQWDELNIRVSTLTKVVNSLRDIDKGLNLVRGASENLAKGNTLASLRLRWLEADLWSAKLKSTLVRLDPVVKYAKPRLEKSTEENSKLASYTTTIKVYAENRALVLSLQKLVQGLSGIPKVTEIIRQKTMDHVNLSTLNGLFDQHEKYSQCVLLFKRFVDNLLSIDHVSVHLSEAIIDKSHKTLLFDLNNHYNLVNNSLLTLRNASRNLKGIDLVGNRLKLASEANSLYSTIKEALGMQLSLEENIQQYRQVIEDRKSAITVTEAEYFDLMTALGKCPTCGNDIDVQKLKEVI